MSVVRSRHTVVWRDTLDVLEHSVRSVPATILLQCSAQKSSCLVTDKREHFERCCTGRRYLLICISAHSNSPWHSKRGVYT